ncbi:hypothetical protein EG244_01880 [Falsigemmobacter faecalis]|uniref:Uncharacterized protein n=1 Tax=Falsigemmobacter faecalis TaxID=2488730 RepID=A0A3P3DVS4_9RHOB|nr:hypothetical protein EG244_01880 [Falsigemmobacter faecalis]
MRRARRRLGPAAPRKNPGLTPANPILRLTDLAAIAAEIPVDSTLATQPLQLAANFEVHSLAKQVCGHGDALGGAVIVTDPLPGAA